MTLIRFVSHTELRDDDNYAVFYSVSLVCFCHQSPFAVLLFLYQICFCFSQVKENKTQVN